MDTRPKQRIWSGEHYDSDPEEDEKPRMRTFEIDASVVLKIEIK